MERDFEGHSILSVQGALIKELKFVLRALQFTEANSSSLVDGMNNIRLVFENLCEDFTELESKYRHESYRMRHHKQWKSDFTFF